VGRRRLTWFLLALVAGGALASTAGASPAQRRPAGSPDLAAMALALSDLPRGVRIESQGYYRDPDFVASYERDFSLAGLRLGRSRVLFLFNDLSVEATAQGATQTFGGLRALLATKAFRDELARAIAAEAGSVITSVSAGRPRTVKIGDGGVSVLFRIEAEELKFDAVLTFLRVDRVLGIVGFVGAAGRRVFGADVDRIDRVSASRMRAGLVPAPLAPPIVSGSPQPAQVLTATQGGWTGDQLTFAAQWERCDGTGSDCSAIPGATAASYTVVPGDLTSTLRITVVGRNRLGAVTASSATTAVVAGPPGSPVATAAPTVTGSAQIGGTLAADAGTWSGAPAVFTYQWRRCNALGGACVDLAGATSSSYTVETGDSRSTLRVLVVAANAVGPGGALSSPTSVVP
jgi:hypothetical protein